MPRQVLSSAFARVRSLLAVALLCLAAAFPVSSSANPGAITFIDGAPGNFTARIWEFGGFDPTCNTSYPVDWVWYVSKGGVNIQNGIFSNVWLYATLDIPVTASTNEPYTISVWERCVDATGVYFITPYFTQQVYNYAGNVTPPTISASFSPSSGYVGDGYCVNWSTTNADAVTFSCTGAASSSGTLSPASGGSSCSTIDWTGTINCTFTATGPGGSNGTGASITSLGNRSAPPPISVSASDYAFLDRVVVTVTPDGQGTCTSRDIVISRDGVDIATIPSAAVTNPVIYDDVNPSYGPHTYSARATCNPVGTSSSSVSDGGARRYPSPSCTAVAPNGVAIAYIAGGSTPLTVSGVAEASSVRVDAWASINGTNDLASYSASIAASTATGALSFDNHAELGAIELRAYVTGQNPGDTPQLCASSSFTLTPPSPPPAPLLVSASDYTNLDRVVVTVDPAGLGSCTGRDIVISRDGVDIATIPSASVTTPTVYNDMNPPYGVRTYGARAVCAPGGSASAVVTDAGARRYPSPTCSVITAAPTLSYAPGATLGVTITGSSWISAARFSAAAQANGNNDLTYYAVTGGPTFTGALNADNHAPGNPEFGTVDVVAYLTGMNPGDAEFSACSTTFQLTQPSSSSPTVSATDYTLADRVSVTISLAAAPACSSRDVVLARDGADIQTFNSVTLGSGTLTYDDVGVAYGVHTYAARAVCIAGPSTTTSAPGTDTGARQYPSLSCPSFSPVSPTFIHTPGGTAPLSAFNVQNALSVRVRAYSDVNGQDDAFIYNTTASGSDYSANVAFDNHLPANPQYGAYTAELLVRGLNPGDTEQVCTTTTFQVVQGCGLVTLSGPQGTGPLPAAISWTSSPAATQYVVQEATAFGGPYTDLATLPSGTTSLSVPGWPKKYYRVQCVAADPLGNSSSVSLQVWGNPSPSVVPQSFPVDNPGSANITPTVSDPDGNTTFTLSVTTPPANGTVSILGPTFTYTPNASFYGDDPFTITATDPGGATGSAVFTAQVNSVPPPAPANVQATDGTRVTDVQVSWTAAPLATHYRVYRGTSGTDPAPVDISGLIASTSFDDTSAVPGVIAYYHVVPYNGPTIGAPSLKDPGFRDTPPTNLSASATTIVNTAVTLSPIVTDGDPGELITYSLETPPSGGTVTFVGGLPRFTPPVNQLGPFSFALRATDRAGAFTTGTASVMVGCGASTLSVPVPAPSSVYSGAGFVVRSSYATGACPSTFDASVKILQGATEVGSYAVSGLQPSTSGSLSVNAQAPSVPGNYTVSLSLVSAATGETITKTATLRVVSFVAPALEWTLSPVIQGIESTSLRSYGAAPCSYTLDPAVAQADLTKCLVEAVQLPGGVVPGTISSSSLQWAGVPTANGSFATRVQFSTFLPSGSQAVLGAVDVPVSVLPPAAMAFAAPDQTAKLYIQQYTIRPAQTSGPTCTLFDDLAAAAAKAASGVRSCVVDWSGLTSDSVASGASAKGVLFDMTPHVLNWSVSLVDAASNKSTVSSGATTVSPVATTLAFGSTVTPTGPYAGITPVAVAVRSTGPDACSALTSRIDVASTHPARPCLVEFGTVTGAAQDVLATVPVLRGTLPDFPTTTVPYTVSVYFNGSKRQIQAGAIDVSTVTPVAPPLSLDFGTLLAPDTYAVSTLGGVYGIFASDTTNGDLTGSAAVNAGTPITFGLSGAKKRQALLASGGPLYASRTVDLEVAYAAIPTLKTTKTITIVNVPRDGLRLNLNSPPATAPDTSALSVSATIVEVTPSGLAYVPANAGVWNVTFGEIASNGQFVPLSSSVDTDSSGTATGSIDVSGRTILRLAAQATPVSPYPAYQRRIVSRTSVVSIVKGTPIEGTIVANAATSGPAPYLLSLSVHFNTRADQLANLDVVWQQSSDGGSTWAEPTTGVNGSIYASRFPLGTHLVKALFRNKNTGEQSETAPITISTYALPKIDISGPTYYLPQSSGTLTATALDANGSPLPSPVYAWQITPAAASQINTILASGTTAVIPFGPMSSGIYRLVVRARDAATDANDPRAWTAVSRQIVVGIPSRPVVRISGPQRLEVGTNGTYAVTVSTAFDLGTSPLTLGGEWTLPDGSKQAGATLDWTPSLADLAAGRIAKITYTAWVNGYESTTLSSIQYSVNLWEYVWPTWTMTKQQSSTFAPASSSFVVLPTNVALLSVLEGLTYTWTVPAGITPMGTPGSKLVGVANFGGSYPVSVVVSDTRGNSTTLSESVDVADPPPVVVDVVAANLNKWSHAPILLGLTTKSSGGHPLDRVSAWAYSVDGTAAAVPSQPYARLNLDTPGTYVVDVTVTTRMGATASKTLTVTVPANTAPTCNPTGVVASNQRSISLKANCVDADGIITNYAWTVNGQPVALSVGAGWTYYLPPGQTLPVTVSVTATDNGGLSATGSAGF